MRLKLMAIFDSASAAFLPPFVVATTAIALRQIRAVAESQPRHDFVLYGDQFVLFELGSFDNETAVFEISELRSLGTMQSILARGE